MRDWLERFVDDGTIGDSQLEEARGMAANLGITPEDALVRLGYISSADLGRAQAEEFGYEYIELEGTQIPNSVIELVTESMARENLVLPIVSDGESVSVAMSNPNNIEVLDKLRFVLNRDIRPVMAPLESIQGAINRHYGQSETESVDSMISEFTETQIDFTDVEAAAAMQGDEDDSAPIIRLANLIISEAVRERASDIHVEPFEDRVRIRYRIDGVLLERDSPPKRLLGALVSRFKIMARMDISEKRRCQDGRIKTRAGNKQFELRVSILRTNHGQAVV
ncbi:MAG: GspE/PulE family protein, partial [Planctomycetaceae bacterium]